LLQNDRVSTVVLVNRRSNVPTEVVIAKKLSGRAKVEQVALSIVVTRLRAINDASIRSNYRRRSGIIIYATRTTSVGLGIDTGCCSNSATAWRAIGRERNVAPIVKEVARRCRPLWCQIRVERDDVSKT